MNINREELKIILKEECLKIVDNVMSKLFDSSFEEKTYIKSGYIRLYSEAGSNRYQIEDNQNIQAYQKDGIMYIEMKSSKGYTLFDSSDNWEHEIYMSLD